MPKRSSSTKPDNSNSSNAKKRSKKRKLFIPRSFLECQSLTHVVGFPPQNELVTTHVASDLVKELFLDRFVKEIVGPFQPETRAKNSREGKNDGETRSTSESGAGHYHVMVGGKLVKKRRISNNDNNQPNRTTPTTPCDHNSQPTDEIDDRLARKRRIWKENVVIGSNQCLRILEDLNATPSTTTTMDSSNTTGHPLVRKPSLIVMAKDMYPPTLCCAVPALAKRLDISLLLLPGKASLELGRALNAKRCSILMFRRGEDDADAGADADGDGDRTDRSNARTAIASFVSYIREQIPRSTTD
jgi:ribosomal protein L7Ae-like RNA K-turn-binding protein